MSLAAAMKLLEIYYQRVEDALKSVEKYKQQNLIPTYFYFEAEEDDENPGVISECKPHAVTPFLEGVVKKLKLSDSIAEAERIYNAVRQSDIFDAKLGMYKTSMSINEEPVELGRIKFFLHRAG